MGIVGPDRVQGQSEDAVLQLEGEGAGVEDGAGEETVSEAVSQPTKVAGVTRLRRPGRLDFKCDDIAAGPFSDQIDLVLATSETSAQAVRRARAEPTPLMISQDAVLTSSMSAPGAG